MHVLTVFSQNYDITMVCHGTHSEILQMNLLSYEPVHYVCTFVLLTGRASGYNELRPQYQVFSPVGSEDPLKAGPIMYGVHCVGGLLQFI